MYELHFVDKAKDDLSRLKKNEPDAFKKAKKLLLEIIEHPTTGTGKPEQLKGRENEWSRRITQKHRLTYRISNETVVIIVLAAYGHYDDK